MRGTLGENNINMAFDTGHAPFTLKVSQVLTLARWQKWLVNYETGSHMYTEYIGTAATTNVPSKVQSVDPNNQTESVHTKIHVDTDHTAVQRILFTDPVFSHTAIFQLQWGWPMMERRCWHCIRKKLVKNKNSPLLSKGTHKHYF